MINKQKKKFLLFEATKKLNKKKKSKSMKDFGLNKVEVENCIFSPHSQLLAVSRLCRRYRYKFLKLSYFFYFSFLL